VNKIEKSIRTIREIAPARFSVLEGENFIHGAFLFKRNRLVSMGLNDPTRIRAEAFHFGIKFNIEKFKKFSFLHSEVDAVRKCWGKIHIDSSYSIVSLRINKKLELKNSKPCCHCNIMLKALGLDRVWWSNDDGDIETNE